ncbi:MAG: hypothetical protein OHK0046_14680 [Anaerolineae bacterium]
MSQDHTVLIVEDTYELAAVIQATLKHLSLSSHHSPSAEDALEYLQTHTPQLILLDINMPGMSGWEFLDILWHTTPHRNINVIVMTAFDSETNRERGQKYGIRAYFSKPFRPSALKAAISDILQLNGEG